MSERLRRGLVAASAATNEPDAPTVLGFGHVVPLLVGAPSAALRLAEQLRLRGIAAHAIRPPTVPPGTARVRLTVTARHTEEDIDRAIGAYAAALNGPTMRPARTERFT